jgi:hypothetical protein
MARGGGVQVGVHVDAAKGTEEFREARRAMNRQLRVALVRAGERAVLPTARLLAPSFIAPTLYVRARGSSLAVITTRLRGKMARVAGLLHWGGVVTTPIRPKRAKALAWPGGSSPVAEVTAPRRYAPKLYLTRAVERRRGAINRIVEEEIMDAFKGFR